MRCKKLPKYLFLLLLCSWLSPYSSAQSNWQWQGGLSFTIGQPINRVGLSFQVKYRIGKFAIEADASQWYRFTGVGALGRRWEGRYGLGGSLNLGDYSTFEALNDFYTLNAPYEIKYLFLRYQESSTPQNSGLFAARLRRFEIILENDALSGAGKDRYRTGSVSFGYYLDDRSRVALDIVLWTGDTHCREAQRIESPGARNGYKDISNCHCGKLSHGILQLRYNHKLYPNQELGLKLGIDSEWIRHLVQNEFMHDIVLALNRHVTNPHIPMLDKDGMPWVDREKQELRKAKLVWGIGGNEGMGQY